MVHMSIMRYDVGLQKYRVFKSVNSDIIPRIGEKIVLREDDSSVVVNVFDIHHNLNTNGVDIYVAELAEYEEYKSGMIL